MPLCQRRKVQTLLPVKGSERPAAKTAAGRERLEALLIEFERRADELDNLKIAPDVMQLRSKLGMMPGMENHNSAKSDRKKSSTRTAVPLYQLKITLKGSQTLIWRRYSPRHFALVFQITSHDAWSLRFQMTYKAILWSTLLRRLGLQGSCLPDRAQRHRQLVSVRMPGLAL